MDRLQVAFGAVILFSFQQYFYILKYGYVTD
jgi:hypothetical protein